MAKSKKAFTLNDLHKSKVASLNEKALHDISSSQLTDIYNQTGNVYYKSTKQYEYCLVINPRGKPRMVRSDAWKGRKVILDYWAWKDDLLKEAARYGLDDLPGRFKVTFYVQMPQSWSKKKKSQYDGTPHLVKPDWDNMAKALQDCICKNDSHIYSVTVEKWWAYNGWIKIETPNT